MPVPTLEFAALALRNADLLLARLTVTDPQEGVITFLLFNFKRNKKKTSYITYAFRLPILFTVVKWCLLTAPSCSECSI